MQDSGGYCSALVTWPGSVSVVSWSEPAHRHASYSYFSASWLKPE